MGNDAAVPVVRTAEAIVYREEMRLLEMHALNRLAATRGVARAPLWPPHDVIQVVTYDGHHVGHIRLDGPHGGTERWLAVRRGSARPRGPYPSPQEAAAALARPDLTPDRRRWSYGW